MEDRMLRQITLVLVVAISLAVPTLSAPQASTPAATNESIVRAFIGDLATKNYAAVEQRFTDSVAQALPLEKFPSTWNSVLAQFGEFQSIESVSDRQVPPFDVFTAICRFAMMKGVLTITLDAQ